MRVPLHGATPAMSKPAFLFRPFLTQHKRSINTHCVLRIPNAPHPITNPTCRRRGTIIITASSSGVQRMPSSGDLRQRPPTQLPESFQLSIQQLQTLLDIGNRGAVYSAGVVTSMDELAAGLCTSKVRGIPGTAQDIQQRRSVYGINALPKPPTTTFWAYVQEALEDFTVRILIIAGVGSIILQTVLDNGSAGDGAAAGWIEGAAILAAVLVVVLVTAVNNYQKERQFMQLNDLQADTLVWVVVGRSEKRGSTYMCIAWLLLYICLYAFYFVYVCFFGVYVFFIVCTYAFFLVCCIPHILKYPIHAHTQYTHLHTQYTTGACSAQGCGGGNTIH